MASTVWKGHLTFGLISIPIDLFSAARSERISFNQLHKECHTRLRQPLFCPNCNRMVERSEVMKGYEHEKDQYVLFTDEELDRKSTRLNSSHGYISYAVFCLKK